MDLDEFRKVYMRAEGIGNTPVKMGKRIFRLGKILTTIPSAMQHDKNERLQHKEVRKIAIENIKKEGISLENVGLLLLGRPKVDNHLAETLNRAGKSALLAGLSVNELGQTAASIVGTKRSNSYDGQDMEHGVRFLLKGINVTSSSIHLTKDILHGAENLLIEHAMIPEYIGVFDGFQRKTTKAVEKTMEKTQEEMEK